MLPSDHGCSPANLFPGQVVATREHDYNWLCDDVEVDYKAEDLTESTILNVLRGRYEQFFPQSKKMLGGPDTRVFLYMNGHGGDNFFKIQDTELIHSDDFGKTFTEMHNKGLYKELLLILDTCEAASMFD
jgi:glycosylphosphatidylinositol transamidase (GPIT) subunit GPI8